MYKKLGFLLVAAAMFSAVPLKAELKFGHTNTQDLFAVMPEKVAAEKQIEASAKKYEDELMKLQTEFKNKYEGLVAEKDSLPSAIMDRRQKDLQELEQRIQNFRQVAYQAVQDEQQKLIAPISDKIQKAIKAVGEEGGYIYIFDLSSPSVLFHSTTQSFDVTGDVKKKLSIK